MKLLLPDLKSSELSVCIVGLGYVGLPLAVEISNSTDYKLTGFDVNKLRINQLKSCIDSNDSTSSAELISAILALCILVGIPLCTISLSRTIPLIKAVS